MIKKRFWNKVKITRKDDCWTWQAATNKQGYGRFKVEGKFKSAHRVAYTLIYGDIPDGLWVLHKCDNPSCVNPFHLFLGTQSDNMKDAYQKGRIKHIYKYQKNSHPPLGEDHHSAKLTEGDVIKIRHSYEAGDLSGLELARKYKVRHTCIYKILNYQTWKNI